MRGGFANWYVQGFCFAGCFLMLAGVAALYGFPFFVGLHIGLALAAFGVMAREHFVWRR